MPYECTFIAQQTVPVHAGAVSDANGEQPVYALTLWPHQSLPRTGFVWFIAFTAALLALPLFSVLGSPVLWGLLPFLGLALAAIWWGLLRSYSDNTVTEDLRLWPDHMSLVRTGPRGARAEWSANSYWVTTALHETGGRVPNYLTLRGGDREVELGAFLSERERVALKIELDTALRKLRWVDTLAILREPTQCIEPAALKRSGAPQARD